MTHKVQRPGRSILTDDRQPTFWAKFEAGLWEPQTLALLDRLLTPQSTFVDIGAWVGPTALWSAFTARRVVALEADPAALEQFRRNLARNPELSRRIEVIDRALHPVPGAITMGARRKPGDSMSSILLAHGAEPDRPVWEAATITPGELADIIPLQEDLIIKLDIEGGEYALLPALMPLLQRARAALISFHPELIQTQPGWNAEKTRHFESEFFDNLADFTPELISGDETSATREWLLER